jgi:hypothetical protein
MRPLRNLLGGRRALEARVTAAEAEANSLRSALHAVAGTHAEDIPPALYAAATSPARDGQAVITRVSGRDVIVVIGDDGGNPTEWWAALHQDVAPRLAS